MATQAEARKTTYNGKEVRMILADLDCVAVEKINGSVLDSGKFGINGTFFNSTGGNLLGVAVNNGVAVKSGGTQTADARVNGVTQPTRRGVMYHFNPRVGGMALDNRVVKSFTDYPGVGTSNAKSVKWAIGGISLHLTQNYTSTQYYNAINASPEYAANIGSSSQTGRTAIAFAALNGRSTIILLTMKDATLWDVREFLRSYGATTGVALDGGGSSQIRYRVNSSTVGQWEPKPDPNRSVYSMVTVNPTTWLTGKGF